jgi:hypothetical protein
MAAENARMQKGTFVIEDWFGPYPGYTTGERWNGWATPYFEYDIALQMVEDWKSDAMKIDVGDELEAYYDLTNDQFCFRSEAEADWDCFPPVMAEVEGLTLKLYPIGAFCWIWSDKNEE